MKRLKIASEIATVLLLGACTVEIDPKVAPTPDPDPVRPAPETFFTATTESFKIAGGEPREVLWSASDTIGVFEGISTASGYAPKNGARSTSAELHKLSPAADGGVAIKSNLAFCPYSESIGLSHDGDSYTIDNVVFPSMQEYGSDPFSGFPMAAVTSSVKDSCFRFKNLCGALRVNIAGDTNIRIRKLILSGNAEEILSGTTSVTVSDSEEPRITPFAGGEKTVTLNCPETGVALSPEGTGFDFVIPPTDFSKGLAITAITTDGEQSVLNTPTAQTVRRSELLSMGRRNFSGRNYVTFASDGENSLTIKLTIYGNFPAYGTRLFYSYDTKTWTEWMPESTRMYEENYYERLTFSSSRPLYLSGMQLDGNGMSAGYRASPNNRMNYTRQFVIEGESKVRCSGNVMSLIDYDELPESIPVMYCFDDLFKDCTQLVSAPELPATTLKMSCYSGMFEGCSSLADAPALPALKMEEYCYASMFRGCTALSKAPELPATQLAESCYMDMFNSTGIVQAPALPAMVMAKNCYYSMFIGCKSLSIAPELPAMTLAEKCYFGMFHGCSSLAKAPELPARELAKDCYYTLFYGCPLINEIKAWFVISLADFYDYYGSKNSLYTTFWLNGVSETGTFYGNPENDWIPYRGGLSRFSYTIPKEWSIEEWVRDDV